MYAPELFKLTQKELKDYAEKFSLSDYVDITDFLKSEDKLKDKSKE